MTHATTPPWIVTFTGRRFDYVSATPADVAIEDIAHALAMQTRWAGMSRSFYSIAQHSVEVSKLCRPKDALWGLLHDAAEAYVTDIPKALKHMPELAGFREVEERVLGLVAERFGLTLPIPESVHRADVVELATEAAALFDHHPENWHLRLGVRPRRVEMRPMTPREAEQTFMSRFLELDHARRKKSA